MNAKELAVKIIGEMGPCDYTEFKNRLEVVESLLSEALEEVRKSESWNLYRKSEAQLCKAYQDGYKDAKDGKEARI